MMALSVSNLPLASSAGGVAIPQARAVGKDREEEEEQGERADDAALARKLAESRGHVLIVAQWHTAGLIEYNNGGTHAQSEETNFILPRLLFHGENAIPIDKLSLEIRFRSSGHRSQRSLKLLTLFPFTVR